MTILVYTDGSCANNGRFGAVGGIGIHFPNKELRDISKIFRKETCTNQKTELYAILTALRYINQNFNLNKHSILIKTDSKYSINCVTNWIHAWIKNGWKTKSGTDVANKNMIRNIYYYYKRYNVEFVHVSAHTGASDSDSVGNAVADKLATKATRRARIESKMN